MEHTISKKTHFCTARFSWPMKKQKDMKKTKLFCSLELISHDKTCFVVSTHYQTEHMVNNTKKNLPTHNVPSCLKPFPHLLGVTTSSVGHTSQSNPQAFPWPELQHSDLLIPIPTRESHCPAITLAKQFWRRVSALGKI